MQPLPTPAQKQTLLQEIELNGLSRLNQNGTITDDKLRQLTLAEFTKHYSYFLSSNSKDKRDDIIAFLKKLKKIKFQNQSNPLNDADKKAINDFLEALYQTCGTNGEKINILGLQKLLNDTENFQQLLQLDSSLVNTFVAALNTKTDIEISLNLISLANSRGFFNNEIKLLPQIIQAIATQTPGNIMLYMPTLISIVNKTTLKKDQAVIENLNIIVKQYVLELLTNPTKITDEKKIEVILQFNTQTMLDTLNPENLELILTLINELLANPQHRSALESAQLNIYEKITLLQQQQQQQSSATTNAQSALLDDFARPSRKVTVPADTTINAQSALLDDFARPLRKVTVPAGTTIATLQNIINKMNGNQNSTQSGDSAKFVSKFSLDSQPQAQDATSTSAATQSSTTMISEESALGGEGHRTRKKNVASIEGNTIKILDTQSEFLPKFIIGLAESTKIKDFSLEGLEENDMQKVKDYLLTKATPETLQKILNKISNSAQENNIYLKTAIQEHLRSIEREATKGTVGTVTVNTIGDSLTAENLQKLEAEEWSNIPDPDDYQFPLDSSSQTPSVPSAAWNSTPNDDQPLGDRNRSGKPLDTVTANALGKLPLTAENLQKPEAEELKKPEAEKLEQFAETFNEFNGKIPQSTKPRGERGSGSDSDGGQSLGNSSSHTSRRPSL